MEVRDALATGNPATFVSRLPVQIDGSCNGLQHYAALCRDLDGGFSVNLLPSDRPQVCHDSPARADIWRMFSRRQLMSCSALQVLAKILMGPSAMTLRVVKRHAAQHASVTRQEGGPWRDQYALYAWSSEAHISVVLPVKISIPAVACIFLRSPKIGSW